MSTLAAIRWSCNAYWLMYSKSHLSFSGIATTKDFRQTVPPLMSPHSNIVSQRQQDKYCWEQKPGRQTNNLLTTPWCTHKLHLILRTFGTQTKMPSNPFLTLITYLIITQLESTKKAAAAGSVVLGQSIRILFIRDGHILRPEMSTPGQPASNLLTFYEFSLAPSFHV